MALFTFNEDIIALDTVKEEPKRVEKSTLFTFSEETVALDTVKEDPKSVE
jgi:hypothetical protein